MNELNNIGHYDYNGDEFQCRILACHISQGKYLIEDIECEVGERGWCSSHLVDDSCFDELY